MKLLVREAYNLENYFFALIFYNYYRKAFDYNNIY